MFLEIVYFYSGYRFGGLFIMSIFYIIFMFIFFNLIVVVFFSVLVFICKIG